MKNSKHALVALMAVLAAGTASAQSMHKNSGYYGELGYTTMEFEESGTTNPKPGLARVVVGKDINENLSIEGMAAFTVSKGAWSSATATGELSARTYGVFAKPKVVVAPDTEIFVRVGLANTSWNSDRSNGASTDDSRTQLVYGAGVQTQLTKDIYGQIDYIAHSTKDDWTAKGFTVSVGTRF